MVAMILAGKSLGKPPCGAKLMYWLAPRPDLSQRVDITCQISQAARPSLGRND